ncbi:DUF3100 domain-containing protein [Clostridium sp.]|uniref:DUF3100 domain-containing protein n=1 Tax=Clostridium sp. TaxID=1506 RepID=UPI003217FFBA
MKERTGIKNALIVAGLITIAAEFIGPLKFKVMGVNITILSLIWAIVIGIIVSPHLLGKIIPSLKKLIGDAEIDKAPYLLAIALYPLGIMFGISAGPQVGIVLQAGPALLLQELGNMSTMLIALPIGVALGLGRSALGGTFSLGRDTALGIIGDKYGLNSPEGIGTLGTYISGSIFGTLLFSFLAPLGVYIGIHPYALAMASGMGSGSMMGAATASLINTVPQMSEQILAYSATSGLLTSVTGIYVELFLSLPLANYYYGKVAPAIERLRGKKKNSNSCKEVK